MKRIVFCFLIFLFIPFSSSNGNGGTSTTSNSQQIPPIEPYAAIDDGFENRDGVIGDLVRIVRSNGWRCDSISAAMRKLPLFNPSKFGFKLSCNNNMYEYEIRNRGGIWVACIEKCEF